MTDIRFATESDLPEIMQLINRAFAVESFFKFSERLNAEQTRSYFENGKFLIYGQKREIAACVYVEVKGEHGYFGLLAVDPGRQKKGLGSRMVAAAEEYARECGAQQMDMTIVNLREELPGFYERLGYQSCGTEEIPAEMMGPLRKRCHFIRYTKALGCACEPSRSQTR